MDISIIIPVRNGLAYTKQCIGVLRSYGLPGCEYIVVDNESADGTREWAESQSDIVLVRGRHSWGLAQSFNRGREKAGGKLLLFLHNDVVCSSKVIPALVKSVELRGVAAAGPYTNRCRHGKQWTQAEAYQSLDEMQGFADKFCHGGRDISVNASLFLESFCLMVRAEVFDEVGGFDEQFSGIGYEDVDFSFRLTQAGYWLCAVSVYAHHGEGSFAVNHLSGSELEEKWKADFHKVWGIDLAYSANIRYPLLEFMDIRRPGLSVLELGCAIGGNLMYIKWNNPDALLTAVELDPAAAKIAGSYGNVTAADAESLDFAAMEGQFDYVIAGDLIEHLKNPWAFVRKIRGTLKPGGAFVASIPNVAHISNVYNLLQGFWQYEDAGLLDRTHLRFFTKKTVFQMFEEAGFKIAAFDHKRVSIPAPMQKLFDLLTGLPGYPIDRENLEAYQMFVKAVKTDEP